MTEITQLDPERASLVEDLSDDEIQRLAMLLPFGGSQASIKPQTDEDGFPTLVGMDDFTNFHELQTECWNKFVKNPQINSYVRDVMGSLTGYGFDATSDIREIQDAIEEIMEDPRNDLYINMPKYVARCEVEGELFLALTVHNDGFVEVDFLDPGTLSSGGDKNSGIVFHPNKPTMPLLYLFQADSVGTGRKTVPIPSINIALYPELKKYITKHKDYRGNAEFAPRKTTKKFKDIGGFRTFVVAWDRGFITPRNVSHIRTTIEWLNHYENLKKYEIDHKKSSGAYLWVAKITDSKAFRTWLSMTDEQRAKSGILQKKTPGGTLVMPPGMDLQCINPQLSSISDQDNDIMRMVISGLNRPEDVITGVTQGSTFSGIKASRGPQSDRTQDDIAYFERFLRFSLWRSIFHLKSVIAGFPSEFKVKEVQGYDDDKEPIIKEVVKAVHKLIYFSFPTSEVTDIESKAKAYLGVKHGSIIDTLGIPAEEVARKLGFNGWQKMRLRKSTEDEMYPELLRNVDQEAVQEKTEAEPSTNKDTEDGNDNSDDNNSDGNED
jgi:hypothetical protein